MKLAIISTMAGGPWAGSEELWAAMAGEALDAGHEVVISVPRWNEVPPKIRDLERRGAQLQRRARRRGPTLNGVLSRLARRPLPWPRPPGESSFRRVFATRPDVFCVSQGGTYDFWQLPDLTFRLRAAQVPFVVVCQANDENSIDSGLAAHSAQFFESAARSIWVSQGNLEAARRQGATSLTRGVVVQNPVNLRDESPVAWPDNPVWQLASIARLHLYTKGQDVLFEALSAPEWRERNWQLNLFGTGPDADFLRQLARHFGLEDRIKFHGHVADVRAIWAGQHLLVMPSRIEGTPLALVEAMLCGRPALATDLAGHPEWIEDGINGWIAAAPTARALGKALERAWQKRQQWQEMGRKAHETATAKRDPAPGKTLLALVLEAACEIEKKTP